MHGSETILSDETHSKYHPSFEPLTLSPCMSSMNESFYWRPGKDLRKRWPLVASRKRRNYIMVCIITIFLPFKFKRTTQSDFFLIFLEVEIWIESSHPIWSFVSKELKKETKKYLLMQLNFASINTCHIVFLFIVVFPSACRFLLELWASSKCMVSQKDVGTWFFYLILCIVSFLGQSLLSLSLQPNDRSSQKFPTSLFLLSDRLTASTIRRNLASSLWYCKYAVFYFIPIIKRE